MMKLFISLIMVLSMGQLYAQGFSDNEPLKKGLYDTFYEFRINNPSMAGEVNYEYNFSGSRVRKIIVDSDTLSSFKKVYGIYDGENFQLDVLRVIPAYDASLVAAVRYSKLLSFGFYSFAEVPTEFNTGMTGGGLIPALIIAGINEAGKDNREKRNVIVAVHHQTGKQFVVEKDFINQLIAELAENEIAIDKKDKYLLDDQIEVLTLYNEYKSNNLVFDRTPFYAQITLTRRGKRQSGNEIQIYLNEKLLGVLEKQFVVIADFTEPILISLKIPSEAIDYQLEIEADSKEVIYYRVSNTEKKKEKIDIDKIDVTRTKYVLEEYD